MKRYNPKEIEPRWQAQWAKDKIYEARDKSDKPKKYILEYFPYPSGAAMHVGHVRNYTIGDAVARHARMTGHNVLHPMGWDAFGLPAENYAIKNNISPQQAIAENTAKFKKQLSQMGFSYDWSREINSSDPDYYKWTQWFFLMLLERGLAYQKDSLQWWCDTDKTVLANEQVEAGKCWRCGNPVVKKPLKQWFFRITDYADRLAADLDKLDWSDAIKTMQRNWIGRSVGAEVEFVVGKPDAHKDTLKFTPELTALIQNGQKTITFRLEAKKLKVGDTVKLITRYSKDETRAFALAKITKIETYKLADLPLDYPGHEKFDSKEAQLAAYRAYYGDEVTPESNITVYGFEKTADIITVFTTRPDTLFGVTFMVLAPEHPLVKQITTKEQQPAVEKYVKQAAAKSDVERQENKEKTGVFTGAYAVNPVNQAKIPIWIADYVLMGYGTGAIMAVPAHDERDFAFAQVHNLLIQEVVVPSEAVYTVIEKSLTSKNAEQDLMAFGKLAVKSKSEDWGRIWEVFVTPDQEPALRSYLEKNMQYTATSTGWYADSMGTSNWVVIAGKSLHVQDGQSLETFKKRATDLGIPAEQLDLPAPTCWHDEGLLVNSDSYDGMTSAEAREKIVQDLAAKSQAKEVTNYKIRDWLISRQRYWGAPIPVIHCPKDGVVPVPAKDLPVTLPEVESYQPTGEGTSVLASVKDWVNVDCPKCGCPAKRETDTMDGFACSSWYFLRFADPHNNKEPFAKDKVDYWCPVDDYIGGAEHAVMHLLYARMWTKVMFDAGMINFDEPFTALRNQGMILAPDGRKMSKSWGNTITPDEIIEQGYGADAIRLMELFIGPWDQKANWSVEGMGGCFRFLQRVWTLVQEFASGQAGENEQTAALQRATHTAIKRVSQDMQDMGFNTSVAALMEFVNEMYRLKAAEKGFADRAAWQAALESLLLLLAPFAPHITEELWHDLGHQESIHFADWPVFDPALLVDQTVTYAIQVNGKLRGEISVAVETDKDAVAQAAQEQVQQHLDGKNIKKTIVVPGKIVNFVAI